MIELYLNDYAIPDVEIYDVFEKSWIIFDVKESFKGGNIVDWNLTNIGEIHEDNLDELRELLFKLPKIVDLYYNLVAEIEELLESVDAITK